MADCPMGLLSVLVPCGRRESAGGTACGGEIADG